MSEIREFLKAAKEKGAEDSVLVELLKQKGWPARTVYDALGEHYEEATGVVVPQPRSSLESAREAFFHLLAFGTLAVWVCAIGSIWFELIEAWLPDATFDDYRPWRLRQVSWQISAIVVSFPVFVLATRSVLADLATNPDKAMSEVRRWLTNLALLITALVFIGDLVTVLAVFLQGDLTARFLAKSAVVLALAGAVFFYYTRGLNKSVAHRQFAAIAGAVIVATLAVGFSYTGTPTTQRERAEDRRAVQKLWEISKKVERGWKESAKLPELLADADGYQPSGDSKYQLCAVFKHPATSSKEWNHPAGAHCYSFNAKTETAYPIQ